MCLPDDRHLLNITAKHLLKYTSSITQKEHWLAGVCFNGADAQDTVDGPVNDQLPTFYAALADPGYTT
jgi:hypothetical protein